MKIRTFIQYILFITALGLVVWLGCAKQGYPPGGPIDKRPPMVVNTIPSPDSTGIARNVQVMIEFSETVDKPSCERSIFITPYSGEDIRYKWKGRQLWITFPQLLAENRTYVITVGTGTKDLRNNAMQASYSLAFSTGQKLDMAQVQGKVYGPAPLTGTQIWAYDLLQDPNPDPNMEFPLYITQTSETGAFNLAYMAVGSYRLFAVMDRDLNTLYDPQFDLLGVGLGDVMLSDSAAVIEDFVFRMALRDTTPPILHSVNAPDQHHVDLRFSEAMQPDSLSDPNNYILFSMVDTLQIMDVYQDLARPYFVHLTTQEQRKDTTYRVKVLSGKDLAGFALGPDTLDVKFKGSAVPDTLGPTYVSMTPGDSSENVFTDTTFTILFSEAMDRESVESQLILADTLGDTLSGSFVWKHGASFEFTPDEDMHAETFYFLTLPTDSTVFDVFGNPLADTLFAKRFTTINPDTLSAIAGSVRDADTTASGPIRITATQVDGAEQHIWLQDEGEYRFNRLLPGRYVLSLFRDQDGDGEYTMGQAFPYQPAERFYIYPDTIEIRSRWPNEGENILLPAY